jgi:hypothetical protein
MNNSQGFQVPIFGYVPRQKKPVFLVENLLNPNDKPRAYTNQSKLWHELSKEYSLFHVTRTAEAVYPRAAIKKIRAWHLVFDKMRQRGEHTIFIDCWPLHDLTDKAQIKSLRISFYDIH